MSKKDIKYEELIEHILGLSKRKKINWKYLDEFESLYQHLNVFPKKEMIGDVLPIQNFAEAMSSSLSGKSFFDVNSSFYAPIGKNFIVLLKYIKIYNENNLVADMIKLFLVPYTYKGIEEIEDDGNLLRLHNYVKAQFPDVDDIIDDIFKLD